MNAIKKFTNIVLVGGLAVGLLFGPNQIFAANTPVKNQSMNANQAQQKGFGKMGMYMGQYSQGNMHEIIAEKLGMTSVELYNARVDGKSIASLLKEKGLSVADVVQAVMEEREIALDEWVKEKMISKDQKEFMLENMKARVEAMMDAEGLGNGNAGPRFNRGSGCPMMQQGAQPKMGQGRMGTGPMWR